MTTDFTYGNKAFNISGPIKPSGKNQPLDLRTEVKLYADIENIPTPYIGMIITVLEDETNSNKMTDYKVLSLKANASGIANSVVDQVQRYVDYLGAGSVSQDDINTAVNNYLTEHPVSGGATAEQAAQIQANKTAIGDENSGLIKKVNDIKNTELQNLNTAISTLNTLVGVDSTLGDKSGLPEGDANVIASIKRIDSKPTGGAVSTEDITNAVNNYLDTNGVTIGDNTITPIKTTFINVTTKQGGNIYNDETKSAGYLNPSGNLIADNYCYTSDFISVSENTNYTLSFAAAIYYYDSSKTFLSKSSADISSFTTPASTAYLRFYSGKSNFVNVMLVEGDTLPNEYVPYGSTVTENTLDTSISVPVASIKNSLLSYNADNFSKLRGLTWNCLGDSITFGAGTGTQYHEFIKRRTGCITRNYGINSSTIGTEFSSSWTCNPMCERYTKMDDDADIISVFGGVNDAGGSTPTTMGDMSSTDKNTFYGAYKTLIEGLINKYPNKVICAFTPLKAADEARQQESLKLIVKAEKEICAEYGVPILDLNAMSGLCPSITSNLNSYYNTDKLHPKEAGHEHFSKIIQSFLESLI